MKTITGRVWKFGDNVSTDQIIAAQYAYTLSDPMEMGRHTLEVLDKEFASQVQPGDLIVAGRNWGQGSAREQAVSCLKALQIGAVIAESFGRIFFRNAFNLALPAVICPQAAGELQAGDKVELDLAGGVLRAKGETFRFIPPPEFLMDLIQAGGLVNHTRELLALEKHDA
ncbi:MAG: 3-isopropylmalate dehydratase small subunit [Desulfarculaceae bacterium]|jgi:3-isopropylmalate/(R)-2-methylmalate dehydratase small subunit